MISTYRNEDDHLNRKESSIERGANNLIELTDQSKIDMSTLIKMSDQ